MIVGIAFVAGYRDVDHEIVCCVPDEGVGSTMYTPNVTNGSYYCKFGLTLVVAEDLCAITESTRDGPYA